MAQLHLYTAAACTPASLKLSLQSVKDQKGNSPGVNPLPKWVQWEEQMSQLLPPQVRSLAVARLQTVLKLWSQCSPLGDICLTNSPPLPVLFPYFFSGTFYDHLLQNLHLLKQEQLTGQSAARVWGTSQHEV